MNLSLASVCGCAFDLTHEAGVTTVTLRSADTTFGRVLPVDVRAGGELIAYLHGVHLAVLDDEEVGLVEDSFCDHQYAVPSLGLDCDARVVDGDNQHLRVAFTLLSDGGDSLDYCHVGVTLDLSLTQFTADVLAAADTMPYRW